MSKRLPPVGRATLLYFGAQADVGVMEMDRIVADFLKDRDILRDLDWLLS